jgi:hypothetical protein
VYATYAPAARTARRPSGESLRGSLSTVALAKEGAPPTRRGTILNPTTPMEPKHDISPAIPQKSPDHNLRITNGVNLGFNNLLIRFHIFSKFSSPSRFRT